MPLIELGYDKYGNVINMVEDFGWGVLAIIAQSRYGKTILIKNIYTQIAKHRNIIILDYQGEHSDSRWGNFRSEDDICFIPNLVTVENFAFYMSDFNQYLDFKSMGFTQTTIPLLRRLLLAEDVHQNDPVIMLEILHDLPVSGEDVEKFHDKYSPDYDAIDAQNYSSKQSLVSRFEAVWDSRLIIPPVGTENHMKYSPNLTHIDDWAELLREHPHLNINLNMFSSDAEMTARASVGKILEKLLPAMSELKPFILVEEADKLCPNTGGEFDSTSQKMLREYSIKHQRTGVKLAYVTQEPHLLDEDTLGAAKTWLFGIHTPNAKMHSVLDAPGFDYAEVVVKKLRHDNSKGIRDFGFIETGSGGSWKIFTPKDSSTRIPRNLNIHSRFLDKKRRNPGIIRDLVFDIN